MEIVHPKIVNSLSDKHNGEIHISGISDWYDSTAKWLDRKYLFGDNLRRLRKNLQKTFDITIFPFLIFSVIFYRAVFSAGDISLY